MKAAIGKAFNTLSGYGRPQRVVGSDDHSAVGQELHRVSGVESQSQSVRIAEEDTADASLTSEELYSQIAENTIEGDDVLFSKNNVFLKQPGTDASDESKTQSLDNHKLIPGFLFVTTRGSNFGTTLLLNWAPNSCMKVPMMANSGNQQLSDTEVPGNMIQCDSISIDLCTMEMIRIFYHMDVKGFIVSGELVIKSKDEQFKVSINVFYFRNGGLNDLIHIFRSWTCFNHVCHKDSHCHTFTVFNPKLSLSELHPLEGKIKSTLTTEVLASLRNAEGQFIDEEYIRKVIYFKGIAFSVRKEVWPFLLGVYSFNLSQCEKEKMKQVYKDKYYKINSDRVHYGACIPSDQRASLEIKKSQIYKDVLRTDRNTEYYKGDGNSNLDVLLKIILNFLFYNSTLSYTQGMTDLLAPLLLILDDEVEAYWCFIEVMKKSTINTIENSQVSVKHQLELLKILSNMLIPSFYEYLNKVENGTSLMFCHRWLIVFFKREFKLQDTLHIWEACWSCFETKFFHLFISIAIMAIFGQRAVDKAMNIDELMVYFNSLSYQMSQEIILSQARGYLYKFCNCTRVHCSLYEIMDQKFWQRSNAPRLFCNICKGFGSCSRTDYLSTEEIVC